MSAWWNVMAANRGRGIKDQLDLVKNPRQNASLGLAAGMGFLFLVTRGHNGASFSETLHDLAGIFRRSCGGREAFTAIRLCFMLVARTYGSLWTARHWGRIVRSVVSLNIAHLKAHVAKFAGATLVLSLLNAYLKYCIQLLKLQMREKITRWCHEKYLEPVDKTFYKVNRVGNNRIQNFDHRITSDVDLLADTYAEVFSKALKPMSDFLVYSVELSRCQGLETPLGLYTWFAFASFVSTLTIPPFAELACKEQELEGDFRSKHSQLMLNCEQIAFLGGEGPEMDVLNRHFDSLMKFSHRSLSLNYTFQVVRGYLNKYFVTVIGLYLVVLPLRRGLRAGRDAYPREQVSEYFASTWRNMEALTSAIQELLELRCRVGRLGGFASRVKELMSGLEAPPEVLVDEKAAAKTGPNAPKFKTGIHLRFEHVSIYKPDGSLLVKDLNFAVERGQRVLITGENGCGKSSLFRVIRKLWPLVEGTITMPADRDIHFITQTDYVPVGTLRELVIYPHSKEQMASRSRNDDDVYDCLRWAHVSPEIVNQGGRAQLEFTDRRGVVIRPTLDDVRDWRTDLSPGQRQRIAFARLFYHKPSFVVLDECTNGVSPDVEHDLYDRCSKLGLGIFSIAHKNELKLFHDYELNFKGDAAGSWSVSKCSEVVGNGKIIRASACVKLPGKSDPAKITYERHVWFTD
eukprot:TRINITY_DN31753_c0_g1_i1.p1 TRINITY_DN31753_c0_g1~~TRINITY_DN31753_c0_g1_i1.p1  ORF type:complete len:687 (-),score=143.63 TRINITY_DN31753_c0_g1_i1:488-2548(-)